MKKLTQTIAGFALIGLFSFTGYQTLTPKTNLLSKICNGATLQTANCMNHTQSNA